MNFDMLFVCVKTALLLREHELNMSSYVATSFFIASFLPFSIPCCRLVLAENSNNAFVS